MFGEHFLVIVADGQEGESFFNIYIEEAGGGQGELFDFVGAVVEADLQADGSDLEEVGFDTEVAHEMVEAFDAGLADEREVF